VRSYRTGKLKGDLVETVAYTPDQLLGVLNDVEQKYAPDTLYTAGDIGILRSGPRVSVVGSRKASEDGLKRARTLTKALVKRQAVVVSGLAEGIDTVAHQTAIESDGKTVAVLGTPLDQVFPVKNRALQERLMRDFLVVSQFRSGHPTTPKSFPIRNRTMALLSDATVIVEAGEKSGTIHQGWEALRLGRPLFLMLSIVENSKLTWPAEMIRYGAHVLERDVLGDFLALLPERAVGEEVAI
jgi:DNA processing protein